MSPPSFSSDTTQVFKGYGLPLSFFSALRPIIGQARMLESRIVTAIFCDVFIIVLFRVLLIIRTTRTEYSTLFLRNWTRQAQFGTLAAKAAFLNRSADARARPPFLPLFRFLPSCPSCIKNTGQTAMMSNQRKQPQMKKSKDFFRFVPISGVFVTLLYSRGT